MIKNEYYQPIPLWININDIIGDMSQLEEVKKEGVIRYFKEDTAIINFGHKNSGIYLLTEGEAHGSIISPNGIKKLVFINEALCFLGDVASFSNAIPTKDTVVLAGSTAVFFESSKVEYLKKTNPFFNELLIKSLSRKSYLLMEHIVDFFCLSPKERIYKALMNFAEKNGISLNDELSFKITQNELANIVGLHRVTVARVFNMLKSNGVIRKNRSDLTLITDKFDHYYADGLNRYK